MLINIGDIAFQSDWQSKNKGKWWYIMFCHCMLWTASICIALQFLHVFSFWKVVFLLGGHWICDYWKSQKPKSEISDPKVRMYNYIDQSFHMVQLIVVFLL